MSKTTNTYNRQNWEDAVCRNFLYFNDIVVTRKITFKTLFFFLGISNFVSNMFRRQSVHSYGKFIIINEHYSATNYYQTDHLYFLSFCRQKKNMAKNAKFA